MSKKRTIIIFVVIAVLAVALILSSTIFRVRKINAQFNAEIEGIAAEDVAAASGIKNGKSIFLVNKNEARDNIEKKLPYAKVDKVFITFPNSVNFVISKRVDFCYFEKDGTYFVCDESLKILRTSQEKPNLIKIDGLNASYKEAGDFVSNSYLTKMFELFGETISIEIDGNDSGEFTLGREKALENIKSITLSDGSLEILSNDSYKIRFSYSNSFDEKVYYIMGVFAGESSSILSGEDKESGKTFVLEKTSSGMRKIITED